MALSQVPIFVIITSTRDRPRIATYYCEAVGTSATDDVRYIRPVRFHEFDRTESPKTYRSTYGVELRWRRRIERGGINDLTSQDGLRSHHCKQCNEAGYQQVRESSKVHDYFPFVSDQTRLKVNQLVSGLTDSDY